MVHARKAGTVATVILATVLGALGSQSIAPSAAATTATYYVSNAGSNANSGAIGSPWRTIAYAAGKLAAGDTLYIRGGTYQEHVRFAASGTADQPIRILAYPGETPVIDGNYLLPPAVDKYGDLVAFAGSYIQADGLEVKNSYWGGVAVSGTDVTVSHFRSHDNLEQGIIAWGATNAVVQDSAVYNNDKSFEGGVQHYADRSGHATGLSAAGHSTGTVLRRNRVYHNWGEGLDTYGSTNNTVKRNVVYDNAKNVYISDTTGDAFARNLIYCTPGNAYRVSSMGQHGIDMQDENQTPASANIDVVNNLVTGCETNFTWYPYTSDSSMQDILIADNTFVDSTGGSSTAAVQIAAPVGIAHSGTRIIDNIIVEGGSGTIGRIGQPSAGITFSNNIWSKTPPSAMLGTQSLVADPLVTRSATLAPGKLTGKYFTVTGSSPAIDAGVTLAGVSADYFGTSRPQGAAPDIGGYEYVAPSG
jgi:parallel beta-helix repeat protein